MDNEYYGVASTPMDDYLAHYGIRGMKWGVRKAIQKGNDRALSRQYSKAEKKLAKLTARAENSKKYAKRAARMGAGAAVAGGLAAAGTQHVGKAMTGVGAVMARGSQSVGRAMFNVHGKNAAAKLVRQAGKNVLLYGSQAGIKTQAAGRNLQRWGKGTSASDAMRKGLYGANQKLSSGINKAIGAGNVVTRTTGRATSSAIKGLKGVSNNTIARIGAGVVGAGLAAGAARNAYKAATAKKKAERFRSEMNKAFAGTQYAKGGSSGNGGGGASPKKRRRRG